MIPGRTRRERRDRESGLIFGWRVPLGSNVWLIASMAIVGLLAVGFAAIVKLHIGGTMRLPERRASLVLVPQGSAEWQSLRRRALEAGPFPARIELAHEPEVQRRLAAAWAELPSATVYQPQWRPVVIPIGDRESPGPMLPPLPAPRPAPAGPPEPVPPLRLVALDGGAQVLPRREPPGGLTRGQRWLLEYRADGRIERVIDLFPAGVAEHPELDAWLLEAKVGGGSPEGGWLAVEVSP